MLHAGRFRHEVAVDLLLDRQRFDGLRARDALVEVPRDLRVDLPDLMMQIEEPPLEHPEKQRDDRHHQEHVTGQLRVDAQHDGRGAQDVQKEIHAIEQLPGEQFSNAAGVADDPRMDVAHAVLVIVVERQFLQVFERPIAHVAVHPELRGEADAHAHVGYGRCRKDEQRVQKRVRAHALDRALLYEMVERVFLQYRPRRVRQTAQNLDKHD